MHVQIAPFCVTQCNQESHLHTICHFARPWNEARQNIHGIVFCSWKLRFRPESATTSRNMRQVSHWHEAVGGLKVALNGA